MKTGTVIQFWMLQHMKINTTDGEVSRELLSCDIDKVVPYEQMESYKYEYNTFGAITVENVRKNTHN